MRSSSSLQRQQQQQASASGGGILISNLLNTWQNDYETMKCQSCDRNNRTKGTEKLSFITFRCDHFHYVCTDCAKMSTCNHTEGNSLCNAPQLGLRQTSTERFPQRPWVQDEARMLNGHRKEVLDWRNTAATDFESQAQFEEYAAERTAIAHDLHDDDQKIVTQAVAKYRSTNISATRRKAQAKLIEDELTEREARCTKDRLAIERALRDENERQIQWLKRQQKENNPQLQHDLEYNIFAGLGERGGPRGATRRRQWPKTQSHLGEGSGSAADSLARNELDPSAIQSAGGDTSASVKPRKRRQPTINMNTRKLPEKPNRKYKFTGTEKDAEKQKDRSNHRRANDFRAAGFRREWEQERFMADIQGEWD